jgi:hypothetical protein
LQASKKEVEIEKENGKSQKKNSKKIAKRIGRNLGVPTSESPSSDGVRKLVGGRCPCRSEERRVGKEC